MNLATTEPELEHNNIARKATKEIFEDNSILSSARRRFISFDIVEIKRGSWKYDPDLLLQDSFAEKQVAAVEDSENARHCSIGLILLNSGFTHPRATKQGWLGQNE